MLPDFERRELAGLPVYLAHRDGKPAAALVFRVGQADEVLPKRGLTHLVEHLVLAPGHRTNGVSGHVDLLTTLLAFEGPVDAVTQWLQTTAAALASPPTDRLEIERRVLAVEGSGGAPGAALLQHWYGARGPGLAAFDEIGLRSIAAGDVVEHAQRYFGRGNAGLVVTGPVDLPDLDLPDGPRRPPPVSAARDLGTLPAEVEHPHGPLSLGAPMPETVATTVLASVLERRSWAALRHERGLAYDVSCAASRVAADERLLALITDVAPNDVGTAAKVLVDQVRMLAAGEIGDDELNEVKQETEHRIVRADPLPLLVLVASGDLVRGRVRPPEATLEELRGVSAGEVADLARRLAERMLLVYPDGASSGALPELKRFADRPVEGERHRRRIVSRRAVAPDLIIGDEGVSAVFDDDSVITVRFATCVAAMREIDGGLTLIDESGQSVTIDPGDNRNGAEAVARAERRLDPALVVGLDERVERVQESAPRPLRPAMVGEASELLVPLLGRDEQVHLAAEATRGIRSGVLAVTDRRLLFVAKLMSEHVEEVPLTSITGVSTRRNPLWPALTVEQGATKTKFTFMTVPRLQEAAAAVKRALREAT